jgi:hypothetical protein
LVSELPKARGVISHGIELAWKVGVQGNVTVMPLVDGLKAQEERRSRIGGGGLASLPGLSGSIIRTRVNGAFARVVELTNGVMLDDGRCQLQV